MTTGTRANTPPNPCHVDPAVSNARDQLLADLPNDLIQLIYLASLRDCNTGHYFHPQISRHNNAASDALLFCHEEVFDRLLAAPLSKYIQQLAGYIGYTHADAGQVLGMWKSLPAYRAAVPLRASALDAEFFFTSIETALTVLNAARLVDS